MKISKTRTLRFNIGAYEHMETSATAEVDTDEMDSDDPVAEAVKFLESVLDDIQADDIDRASQASVTPELDTALTGWKDS